ncbi:MAG: biotin/lipoyl-containing protein [Anaerolineae bacterium]
MKYIATIDGQDFIIDIDRDERISLEDTSINIDLESIDGRSLFSLVLDGASYEVFVERHESRYFVTIEGDRYEVQVEDERIKQLRELSGAKHEEAGELRVAAPMPGLVVDVLVEEGQQVSAGDGVVILEAMKMENEIRSSGAGLVESIRVSAGQTVNQGDVMVELGPPE